MLFVSGCGGSDEESLASNSLHNNNQCELFQLSDPVPIEFGYSPSDFETSAFLSDFLDKGLEFKNTATQTTYVTTSIQMHCMDPLYVGLEVQSQSSPGGWRQIAWHFVGINTNGMSQGPERFHDSLFLNPGQKFRYRLRLDASSAQPRCLLTPGWIYHDKTMSQFQTLSSCID